MKYLKSIFVLAVVAFIIFSCKKDGDFSSKNLNGTEQDAAKALVMRDDTSAWELYHIHELIKGMDDQELLHFLNAFGHPDWEHSFQKRGEEINITTVPMVKGDNITGVIKLYNTDDDSIRVNFFPVPELDSVIMDEQGTEDFHIYRGAIQSLIISATLMGKELDSKYIDWIVANEDRIDERVAWYCIEEWECNGVYTNPMTGWSYDSGSWHNIGYNLPSGQDCNFIQRECWVDFSPRTFFGRWSNWIPPNTNNQTSGGGGTNGDSPYIYNATINLLNAWMNEHGVPAEYLSLFYDCVVLLIHPSGQVDIDSYVNPNCITETLLGVSVDGLDLSFRLEIIDFLGENDWSEEAIAEARKLIFLYKYVHNVLGPQLGLNKEEMDWLVANLDLNLALAIVDFLEDVNNPNDVLVAGLLLEIQINSNGNLTNTELQNILNAFELYFDNPSANGEALITALFENGVNPLATNTGSDALIEDPLPLTPPTPPGTPMSPAVFWQKAGAIKQSLLDQYPSKATTINAYFACRVLGPAMEEATLNSLGIPKNTAPANGSIPDGWSNYYIVDGLFPPIQHSQPVLIEVKGRFAGNSFDYNGQLTQLQNYLNYLQSHAYAPNTVTHGLYMILPDGVTLAQSVISSASSQNVPILLSGVELGDNDVNQFRVKNLEVENLASLDYSGHLLSWLPPPVIEFGIKQNMQNKLAYASTLIDFQKHATAFEISYLQNNNPPSCPND